MKLILLLFIFIFLSPNTLCGFTTRREKEAKIREKYNKQLEPFRKMYVDSVNNNYTPPHVRKMYEQNFKEISERIHRQQELEIEALKMQYPHAQEERAERRRQKILEEQKKKADRGWKEYYKRQEKEQKEWKKTLEENKQKAKENQEKEDKGESYMEWVDGDGNVHVKEF